MPNLSTGSVVIGKSHPNLFGKTDARLLYPIDEAGLLVLSELEKRRSAQHTNSASKSSFSISRRHPS
jgi:hypothetical protein